MNMKYDSCLHVVIHVCDIIFTLYDESLYYTIPNLSVDF